ncbi:MAG: replication-relaxation family protein [Chloroflexi bacterium]|nr:replication-relaxation family protein [Chloroflexota bacterium]
MPAESLATVLGWEVRRVRQRRQHLIQFGLVRLLGAEEIKSIPADDLTELTEAGLRLVAAQHGLSLTGAIRFNGLAGGSSARPFGTRELLTRNLNHTVGADGIFVGLHRIVRTIGTSADDDGVLEWRNAAACIRGRVKPDGYGMVRLHGQPHGFFLEYDRGTMSARDYGEKWGAYYDYRDSRAFEHDYDGFPTILVVTTSNAVEERIARTVRAVSVGRSPTLPILLTSEWRITHDPANQLGLLGPIWRTPFECLSDRCPWPSGGVNSIGVTGQVESGRPIPR